jgi:hypothetical protein
MCFEYLTLRRGGSSTPKRDEIAGDLNISGLTAVCASYVLDFSLRIISRHTADGRRLRSWKSDTTISPLNGDERTIGFGDIHRYDFFASRRRALSQPQVSPVSKGQMGEARLWDDSSLYHFAGAVIPAAFNASLRGGP